MGPQIATTGVPTATAKCIGPLSLVSKTAHRCDQRRRRAQASSWPAASTARCGSSLLRDVHCASARSCGPPSNTKARVGKLGAQKLRGAGRNVTGAPLARGSRTSGVDADEQRSSFWTAWCAQKIGGRFGGLALDCGTVKPRLIGNGRAQRFGPIQIAVGRINPARRVGDDLAGKQARQTPEVGRDQTAWRARKRHQQRGFEQALGFQNHVELLAAHRAREFGGAVQSFETAVPRDMISSRNGLPSTTARLLSCTAQAMWASGKCARKVWASGEAITQSPMALRRMMRMRGAREWGMTERIWRQSDTNV